MCKSSLPRCCRGALPVFTLAIVLSSAASSLSASSPGAAFAELPKSPVVSAFTMGISSMTTTVISGITAIPEPASCFLFGTGVFALLAMRRRALRRRG